MHCLGSHVSVAGGLQEGVRRAVEVGCQTLQIFTKNANAWKAKPLDQDAVAKWRSAFADSGLAHPIAHTSYLINLASPQDELYRKSIDALVIEWQRCELLDLEGLVLHPGSFTTGNEADGIRRIIEALVETISEVEPKHCRLLLENTAGQGTALGHRIEQLGRIIDGVRDISPKSADSLGVCIDSCHAFAAGYEIHTEPGLKEFCRTLSDSLPRGAVRAMHLNDSKKPLGSRVDRHEHIGRGEIGCEAFRRILAEPLFEDVPGYLETEKGIDPETGKDWDAINLSVLRSLLNPPVGRKAGKPRQKRS